MNDSELHVEVEFLPFDRERYLRFKRAYDQQIEAGRNRYTSFEFEGHEFVMAYAKYMVELLESVLKGKSDGEKF